jgi:hypothetical protein
MTSYYGLKTPNHNNTKISLLVVTTIAKIILTHISNGCKVDAITTNKNKSRNLVMMPNDPPVSAASCSTTLQASLDLLQTPQFCQRTLLTTQICKEWGSAPLKGSQCAHSKPMDLQKLLLFIQVGRSTLSMAPRLI